MQRLMPRRMREFGEDVFLALEQELDLGDRGEASREARARRRLGAGRRHGQAGGACPHSRRGRGFSRERFRGAVLGASRAAGTAAAIGSIQASAST